MPFKILTVYAEKFDEETDPNVIDPEFHWTRKAIRLEFVKEVEELEEGKIYISFLFDNVDPIIAKHDFDDITNDLQQLTLIKE